MTMKYIFFVMAEYLRLGHRGLESFGKKQNT